MATLIAAEPWPTVLERERSLSWMPDFGNQRGPPGLDGTSQYRNSNGGGLWMCSMNGEQLRRREHVMSWLTMEARLRGGMTPVDVPLLLCQYQPKPATGATVQIKATSGWAARAMAGRVTLVNSAEIEAGNHFADYDASVYGWRLYRIDSVTVLGGANRDITFWPPARVAVAANHFLEFDNPRCVMRLAASNTMDVDLEMRKRANPSAEFIEAY